MPLCDPSSTSPITTRLSLVALFALLGLLTAPAVLAQGDPIVADSSFEAGTPNPAWTEFSTVGGTSLCSAATCGGDGGLGAFDGDWWVWFGRTTGSEISTLTQEITIPTTVNTLSFYLQIPTAEKPGAVRVDIDGTRVFQANENDADTYSEYQQVLIEVDGFADGGTHTLAFSGIIGAGDGTQLESLFVDLVTLTAEPREPSFVVEPVMLSFGEIEQGETSTGTFAVDAGATLDFSNGPFDLTTASFSGNGTLDFGRVGVLTLMGSYDLGAGTTRLSGNPSDTVTFDAAMSLVSLGATLEAGSSSTMNLEATPGQMPATIALSSGATLNPTPALTVQLLSLGTSGTPILSGTSDVTTDSLLFRAGRIEGGGTVIVTGGALISGTSFARDLIGRTLRLNGPTTVSGGNPLRMGDGAVVEIAPGTLLDIQSDGDIKRTGTITTEPVIENAGTIRKSTGSGIFEVRVDLVSAGTVDVASGELRMERLFSNEAGGTVIGTGTLDLTNSLASFANAGTFAPGASPGILTFQGDYTMDASAVLEAEISGTTPGVDYDQLVVEGDAALDGTLRLADIVGGTVTVGTTFTILTATGTVSGTFDTVVPPFGYAVDLAYNPQNVVVTVTQVPNFDLIAANTTPLTVQAGGSVAFDYSISNNTTNGITGSLWFVAERGGGTVAQSVIRSGTLPGGATINGSYTQAVPASALPGAYTYRLRIGQFPSPSVDEEVFTVTVAGSARTGEAAAWSVRDATPWQTVGATQSDSAQGRVTATLPSGVTLTGAYPNPFSRAAAVAFALPEAQRVSLVVYDVLGREVVRLVDSETEAGRHAAVLDGSGLPSGVYLVRLTTDGGFAEVQRITLLR